MDVAAQPDVTPANCFFFVDEPADRDGGLACRFSWTNRESVTYGKTISENAR
jgi:hypothetical protein